MPWALLLTIAMQAASPSPVVVVARESMSNVEEPSQTVARTAAEWAALWRRHAGDAQPMPKVDLSTRTIVAVFLGTRSTAGYAVEIVGTRDKNGSLVVLWEERRPDRTMITAQVLTTPAVIASIPKFAGPITFEKVEK